jgi:hypothetical protein
MNIDFDPEDDRAVEEAAAEILRECPEQFAAIFESVIGAGNLTAWRIARIRNEEADLEVEPAYLDTDETSAEGLAFFGREWIDDSFRGDPQPDYREATCSVFVPWDLVRRRIEDPHSDDWEEPFIAQVKEEKAEGERIEAAKKAVEEAEQARRVEERERRQLAELRAKYEGGS